MPCLAGVCTKLCAIPGGACATGEDCCDEKACVGGICGDPPACTPEGQACMHAADCCLMSCVQGFCGPCPDAYACADVIHGDAGSAQLCGEAAAYYAPLFDCLCNGACEAECGGDFCVMLNPTQGCVACAQSPAGCGAEYDACLAH